MKLYDYQQELVDAAAGHDNVLLQADTGAGKTRVLARLAQSKTHVLIIAHRNKLITQLSCAFAELNVKHNLVCSISTKKRTSIQQVQKFGKSSLSERVQRYICSIDTIISHYKHNRLDLDQSKHWLILIDEAHHVTDDNKWGKLREIFINHRIVGVTATPCRLDGKPLKNNDGGVFDRLERSKILGNDSVNTLIQRGILSAFKCFARPSLINEDNLRVRNGDYTLSSLIEETLKHSDIMAGNAIDMYKTLAFNKKALGFCVSINVAEETAKAFRNAGISAAAVHSKLSHAAIDDIFWRFENQLINVIFNVDLVGEGIDIPTIDCLIMLRKTASLALYRQWIGRSLRYSKDKQHTIILDHADNIRRHGLPNRHIEWSLVSVPDAEKSNLVPCEHCGFLNKAWTIKCDNCGKTTRGTKELSMRDVQYINLRLVERYRSKEYVRVYEETPASECSASEIRNLKKTDNVKLHNVCNSMALWFFDNVKHHTTRGELEHFLLKNNNIKFWSTHFSYSDIDSRNENKCLKVFNAY